MNKQIFWIYLISLVSLIIISAFCEAPFGICGYLFAAILTIQGQFPKKFGGRFRFLLKHTKEETWERVHLIISVCLTTVGTIGLLVKIIFWQRQGTGRQWRVLTKEKTGDTGDRGRFLVSKGLTID